MKNAFVCNILNINEIKMNFFSDAKEKKIGSNKKRKDKRKGTKIYPNMNKGQKKVHTTRAKTGTGRKDRRCVAKGRVYPKKRPTRRGTSLGMVSLAKRIAKRIIQMGRVGRLDAIGYITDGGVYVWDLVGGGGVF